MGKQWVNKMRSLTKKWKPLLKKHRNPRVEEYNYWTEDFLEIFNCRFDQAEERNNGWGDRSFEIIQSEKRKEKRMRKCEESLCK